MTTSKWKIRKSLTHLKTRRVSLARAVVLVEDAAMVVVADEALAASMVCAVGSTAGMVTDMVMVMAMDLVTADQADLEVLEVPVDLVGLHLGMRLLLDSVC